MSLSRRSLETLIDLVENKLSCVEIFDRDDQREVINLEHCLKELKDMAGLAGRAPADLVVLKQGRRGRRRLAV
ncbi:MAG: hypothetical protein ACFCUQ_02055 [Kiloniellales bacterium]